MEQISGRLTILFEDPFWIGIFEKIENGKLSVAKVIFGAEPKDCEVFEFILRYANNLEYSPEVTVAIKEVKKNPKKKIKDVKSALQETGIGTKSQQALKLQQEQHKTERKIRNREKKEAEAQRLFELRMKKKKDKRKGH